VDALALQVQWPPGTAVDARAAYRCRLARALSCHFRRANRIHQWQAGISPLSASSAARLGLTIPARSPGQPISGTHYLSPPFAKMCSAACQKWVATIPLFPAVPAAVWQLPMAL